MFVHDKKRVSLLSVFIIAAFLMLFSLKASAKTASEALPNGGIGISLSGYSDLIEITGTGTGIEGVINTQEEARMLSLEKEEEEIYLVAVTEDYIGVYAEEDEESELIGKIYNDCKATVIEMDEEWCLIESGAVIGYMKYEGCLIGEEALEALDRITTPVAVVDNSTMYLRSEPSKDAEVVSVLTRGDEFEILEGNEDWVKGTNKSEEGWLNLEYIEIEWRIPEAETLAQEEERLAKESYEKGCELVDIALKYVGKPYIWGGSNPEVGADCSGFTMYLYGLYGYSITHSVEYQATLGKSVSLEEAQPGDIVIYSGHVAIYMGDGKIVHAANRRLGICISNITFMTMKDIRRIF